MSSSNSSGNGSAVDQIFYGSAQNLSDTEGITTKAFVLNLATGFVLFTLQTTGFLLLKNSSIGRRL